MADLTRPQLALCALAAVVVLLLGARQLGRGVDASEPRAPVPTPVPLRVEAAEDERVVVHVAGAVRRPGIYRLLGSSRVDDAVRLAGGATRRADLAGLNLAAKVEDGRQILVPKRVPASASVAAPPASATAAGAPTQPVNLNTATLEQLDVLPGVGPATAQRILDFREANGGFGSVEDLSNVPGIGDVRMASLRELVRV
jgi:competence protein ComEA